MRSRVSSFIGWSLACFVLSTALPGALLAEELDAGQPGSTLAQASAHFAAAQALYERGAFTEALAEFSASQALVSSPNSRLYRARCLREMGELVSAHAEYASAVLEAGERAVTEPRYAATQRAATEERAALRQRLAFVVVTMPAEVPAASLYVGSKVVASAAWGHELALAPGRVEVRAEAPGRRAFALEVDLHAGKTRRITIDLSRREPSLVAAEHDRGARGFSPFATSLRQWGFVSGAVGVAGLVTWGAFGAAASSRYDDLEKQCLGRCDASRADDIAAGRRESAVSTIGLVAGVAGIAAGAALYAVDVSSLRTWLAPSETSAATLELELSPGGAILGGTF